MHVGVECMHGGEGRMLAHPEERVGPVVLEGLGAAEADGGRR